MGKLKSRKLWLAIAGVVGAILMAVSGQVEWAAAADTIKTIVLGYLAAQGTVDFANMISKK